MEFAVYAGETVELTIDLDTSSSDTTYDVSSMTLVFRVTPIGAASAVYSVAPAVLDAGAGTLTVTLDATVLLGIYDVQVIDTTQPLVLAQGLLTVMPMAGVVAV